MGRNTTITFSAPGKVHLLGEHSVVYGKPALLASIDLRSKVTISSEKIKDQENDLEKTFKKIIESIVKKYLKLKSLPAYYLAISTKLPVGSGLGSSASIASAYIASLLTFLKSNWDINLINDLTYESEKTFHGNPSGADNTVVCFGGLIWYRKETDGLKLIQKLALSLPQRLIKNFVFINTGTPKETTKTMVSSVKSLSQKNPRIFYNFLQKQEQLTKELFLYLKEKNEKKIKNIIKMGQFNLENIGVVSKTTSLLIKEIESTFGVAKICGGGGKKGPTGILLCYHSNPERLIDIASKHNLEYFKVSLGVEGLKKE